MKVSISSAVSPRSMPPEGSLRSLPKPASRAISSSWTFASASRMREPPPCLSSGTIAQFVEDGAGGCALQHAERPETVGNDGDQPGRQPHFLWPKPVCPLASPTISDEFRQAVRRGRRHSRWRPAHAETGRDCWLKPGFARQAWRLERYRSGRQACGSILKARMEYEKHPLRSEACGGRKTQIQRQTTSACVEVLAGSRRGVNQQPLSPSGIRGELWRGLDQRQSAVGKAGLHEAVAVMGDVGLGLPVKISQVAFRRSGPGSCPARPWPHLPPRRFVPTGQRRASGS